VAVLTIDRPDKANSIDLETALELSNALDELAADPATHVVVLTGAGDRVFCAGMDLGAVREGLAPRINAVPGGFAGLVRRSFPKPVVAAVEGAAIGGGFEIVLACDLVVAAENASFGLPEVRRGLVASAGGLLRLQHRIPFNLAAEWVLTGAAVGAAAAHQAGLVNRLVPPGTAVAAALELAAVIAANAPLAVRASKRVLRESPDWPGPEAFDRQAAVIAGIGRSADAREGARAFTEKRAPAWRGE
jgi:enoyl-CoA hydratase